MALVSSISSMFKENPDNEQEKNQKRKAVMLNILDKTLQQYYDKLNQGRIKINSTIDLERIVRSSIALMETSNTSQDTPVKDDIFKIPDDDPDVQALYQKLYAKYNKDNDTK